MLKKMLLLSAAVMISIPSMILASEEATISGRERTNTVDQVSIDEGNDWRPISVAQSTTTAVLISSSALTSGLGVRNWRSRLIINKSTCAALTLFPNSTYSLNSTSFSVTLSSDPSGLGEGDSVILNDQSSYWGIWSPGVGVNGRGAGGWEKFYNFNK